MTSKLFQQQSLTEVAASLDVHPFDIARMYGQDPQGLPKELRFSTQEKNDIAKRLGLEIWWPEKNDCSKNELLLRLAQKIQEKKLDTPTRGDNLYRGLEGENFQLVRSAVNTMIRIALLQSASGPFGIVVSKGQNFDSILEMILDEGRFPPELQELMS